MDLSEMITAVRNRLGIDDQDSYFDDTVLTDFINEALYAIEAEDEWPWDQKTATFSTVANQTVYNTPDDWYRTKALYINNFNPLDNYPIEEVDQVISTSRPRIFCVFGDQIILKPIPDQGYTVNHQYYASPAALVSGTDTPELPVQFHPALVAKALAIAYQRANYEAAHNAANQEYQTWLERMLSFKRRVTGPTRPRIRPGNDW